MIPSWPGTVRHAGGVQHARRLHGPAARLRALPALRGRGGRRAVGSGGLGAGPPLICPAVSYEEGAWVHHSYGSYAPSTYRSYEPRRANPSTGGARH